MAEPEQVEIAVAEDAVVRGVVRMPDRPRGFVVFAYGSGSGKRSPRSGEVAAALAGERYASIVLNLLTPDEIADDARSRRFRFDVQLLTERLDTVVSWAATQDTLRLLSWGVLGAGTGAAAALKLAAQRPDAFAAVVLQGGRPDLAMDVLARVRAPTLMIVGSRDPVVLDLNHSAGNRMTCQRQLAVVSGASHLFPEEGAIEQVAELAAAWFEEHLGRHARERAEIERRTARRTGSYRDRLDAGERLAEAVEDAPIGRLVRPLVLALPRGGVEVAAPVARRLGAPLDVVVATKVGVPWQPELAMGAVDESGTALLDDGLISRLEIEDEVVEDLVGRAGAAARQSALRFRDGAELPPISGRDVVLVDDGFATGMTARAGARLVAQKGARRVVFAVPVAPATAPLEELEEFDAVVCPYRPALFRAVASHYESFPQLEDADVIIALREARLHEQFQQRQRR